MLTRLRVKATFKVVGEKARVLEQRGRTDVIAALKRHEIGYHSNTHSQQPTIAVYLQHAGWDDGRAEFERREGQGSRDVARIFGTTPVAYGQPGSAWAPQSYPALRAMGIGMYLDEADHVGIDDQPFYYGGMLNVFKMRSTLARMALDGTDLAASTARFTKIADALRARGGGTISIYYHPSEWVHAEFWDAVNFSRGANPPRAAWKRPRTRPAAETETAFADFEQYIRFIQQQPGVSVCHGDGPDAPVRGPRGGACRSRGTTCGRSPPRRSPRSHSSGVRARPCRPPTSSACSPARWRGSSGPTPCRRRRASTPLAGPTRPFAPAVGGSPAPVFPWEAFSRAITDAGGLLPRQSARCRTRSGSAPTACRRRIFWRRSRPSSSASSPRDSRRPRWHAATAASPRIGMSPRTRRSCGAGRSFPRAFTRPAIMALARLQAWTLKPAVLALAGPAQQYRANTSTIPACGYTARRTRAAPRRRVPFHESRLHAQMTRRVGHAECVSC